MARFVFELQAALEQRERLERTRQTVVAQLQAEATELEGFIRRTQAEIMREKEDLRGALRAEQTAGRHGGGAFGGAPVDLDAARRQGAAALGKVREAQQAAIKLAGVLRRLDNARLDLLEAARQRKAVELLRDRRYEEWKRNQMRRETAELDELAVMRAGRSGAEPEGASPGAAPDVAPGASRRSTGDAA